MESEAVDDNAKNRTGALVRPDMISCYSNFAVLIHGCPWPSARLAISCQRPIITLCSRVMLDVYEHHQNNKCQTTLVGSGFEVLEQKCH